MAFGNFRKPRLNVSPARDAREQDVQQGSEESLLTFVEHYRRSVLSASSSTGADISDNDSVDGPLEGNDSVSVSDTRAEITKNEPLNQASEEGISMLEPHLAAFRKRMDEGPLHDTSIDDNSGVDMTLDIPPQLLRVVRFFPFKWIPLKRALLRPSSKVRMK